MSNGQVTRNGLIGTSISKRVYDQLKLRENALANKGTEPKWQKLYTSKTAWVKLSSSVNVDGDGGAKAKSNILTGRGITGDSGVNPGYNTSENLGIRPIPGLTNLSIQSINRFGTLRNAVVEFKVYDVERLSDLESLYMRPGFSILLEWGHTAYKTASGVSTSPKTVDGFFTNTRASVIEKKIRSIEESTEGNYAGLFGYIKNFQWSFNIDGSYNCRIEIISKGELLESIQYAIYPPVEEGAEEGEEANLDKNRSPIHRALYAIKEDIPSAEDSSGTQPAQSAKFLSTVGNIAIANKLIGRTRVIGPFSQEEGETGDQYLSYIQLGALLEVFNIAVLPKDRKQVISPFAPNIVSRYVTHPFHFSGNPGVCRLPKDSKAYPGLKGTFLRTTNRYTAALGTPPFNSENVHEIWLNVDYLLTELNNTVDDRTGQALVFTFLQNVLAGVEGALGGINELDIAYDEELNVHYIIDRRYIGDVKKLRGIRVSGKATTATNLSITSKLSPRLGTLIAISAQASQQISDVGIEAENLFKWNDGLEDRIITERIVGEEKSPEITSVKDEDALEKEADKQEDPYQKARKKIIKALKRFAENIYKPSDYTALTSSHILVQKTLLRYNIRTNKKPSPGIIPFELSITLDGISGFKIGETFDIEDHYIFPKRYRGAIAFIITGLEHSIQGNRWTTTIKAQTVTK